MKTIFFGMIYLLSLFFTVNWGRSLLNRPRPASADGHAAAYQPDHPGLERFMDSLRFQDEAIRLHFSDRQNEAFGQLDEAENLLTTIRSTYPEFHPAQVEARLEACARLRKEWENPKSAAAAATSSVHLAEVRSAPAAAPAKSVPKAAPAPAVNESAATPPGNPATLDGNATSLWFRAFTLEGEGKTLEIDGKTTEAFKKYEEARRFFETLQTHFPDFRPGLVEDRLEKTARKLEELRKTP